MLNESIESSPQSSNKCMQHIRLVRKRKRHKLEKEKLSATKKNKDDATIGKLLLTGLYRSAESDGMDSSNSCHSDHIDDYGFRDSGNVQLFENEIQLTLADRSYQIKVSADKQTNGFIESKNFFNCQSYFEDEILTGKTQIDTPSYVTESELIHCCDRAIGENVKIVNSISTVDTILKDFNCPEFIGSATTLERLSNSPLFMLLERPIRTYIKKKNSKLETNSSAKYLDNSDDDILSTSSSMLSLQEDYTQVNCYYMNHSPVSNTSQLLCENLLNISSYFSNNSQNIERNSFLEIRKSPTPTKGELNELDEMAVDQFTANNIKILLDEIISLRKNNEVWTDDLSTSSQEFYGFSEAFEIEKFTNCDENSLHIDVKNVWNFDKMTDPILEEIYEKLQANQLPSTYLENLYENLLKSQLLVIDLPNADSEIQADILVNDFTHESICSYMKRPDSESFITKEDFIDSNMENPSTKVFFGSKIQNHKDMNLFDDSKNHDWQNDDELLFEITTQNVNSSENQPIITNHIMAIRKRLFLSKEIQSKKDSSFSIDFREDFIKSNHIETDLNKMECHKNTHLNNRDLDGPLSMKSRNSTLNDPVFGLQMDNKELYHLKQKTLINLIEDIQNDSNSNSQYHPDESDSSMNISNANRIMECNSSDRDKFVDSSITTNSEYCKNFGFQTANGKIITISDKAQQSVKHLLNEFEHNSDDINGALLKQLESMKNKIYSKRQKKNINIEDTIQVNLQNMGQPIDTSNNFVSLITGNVEDDTIDDLKNNVSYQLDSKKNSSNLNEHKVMLNEKKMKCTDKSQNQCIEYIGKEKCLIEHVKDNFPTIENECANLILSEWPLSPCQKSQLPLQKITKCKMANCSTNNIDILSPVNQNSQCELIRSYNNTNYCKHLSEVSPLNPKTASSIRTRKNLLSLSKKRKIKQNQSAHSINFLRVLNTSQNKPTTVTPPHKKISLKEEITTPSTPVLIQEFVRNVSETSTPHSLAGLNQNNIDEEDGIKLINWQVNNIENSLINNQNNSREIIRDNLESNTPTINERIDGLSIYGDAFPITPNSINRQIVKCRPSGLRRTRSMLAKTLEDKN